VAVIILVAQLQSKLSSYTSRTELFQLWRATSNQGLSNSNKEPRSATIPNKLYVSPRNWERWITKNPDKIPINSYSFLTENVAANKAKFNKTEQQLARIFILLSACVPVQLKASEEMKDDDINTNIHFDPSNRSNDLTRYSYVIGRRIQWSSPIIY